MKTQISLSVLVLSVLLASVSSYALDCPIDKITTKRKSGGLLTYTHFCTGPDATEIIPDPPYGRSVKRQFVFKLKKDSIEIAKSNSQCSECQDDFNVIGEIKRTGNDPAVIDCNFTEGPDGGRMEVSIRSRTSRNVMVTGFVRNGKAYEAYEILRGSRCDFY